MTVCFVGHADFNNVPNIEEKLKSMLDFMISEYLCSTFIFGSKSAFDDFCWKIVNDLKKKYPNIILVNFACKHEHPLLRKNAHGQKCFDKIVRPINRDVGKYVYIERNKAMIDERDFCVFFYDENHQSKSRNSGTKIAYEYAKRKNKRISNLFSKI